jgi:hypothetical protein
MARTLRDQKLDTRNSREPLRQRREPFWRSISGGLAVGYRKSRRRRKRGQSGQSGGTWIARHYSAEHGRRYRALVL